MGLFIDDVEDDDLYEEEPLLDLEDDDDYTGNEGAFFEDEEI